MSVKEKISDSYQRVAVKVRHPSMMALKGIEGIVDFATPIASVLTIGADPKYNIAQKILEGPYQAGKVIFDTVSGYATNVGMRDFFNGQMGQLFHLIGNAAQNVTEKPLETLATVASAYALGKATKYAVGVLRKSKEDKYLAKRKG